MRSRIERRRRSSRKRRSGGLRGRGGNLGTVRFGGGRACDGSGSRRSECAASLVKHVSEGDTVKLKSMGRAAVVKKKIDENHFDVEIGSMKMRIARDDIAEVVARVADSPVEAARARGIRVSLDTGERRGCGFGDQRDWANGGRGYARGRAFCGSGVSGRNAARADCAWQRDGNSAQGAAGVFEEASACGDGGGGTAERGWGRGYGGGVAGIAAGRFPQPSGRFERIPHLSHRLALPAPFLLLPSSVTMNPGNLCSP